MGCFWGRQAPRSPPPRRPPEVGTCAPATTAHAPRPLPAPARTSRKIGGKAGKKMATQLSVGMKSFCTLNTKKYDLHLFFAASQLLRLEVRGTLGGGRGGWGWVFGGRRSVVG